MLVSACVQQCDGVLAQVSFQNGHSSEIGSLRQLLDELDVTGAWVTLDALLAKKTVEVIVGSGNDYCIGLKNNQPNLLHQAQQCAQTQAAISDYHSCDRSRGRVVKRRVRVFASPPALSQDHKIGQA